VSNFCKKKIEKKYKNEVQNREKNKSLELLSDAVQKSAQVLSHLMNIPASAFFRLDEGH